MLRWLVGAVGWVISVVLRFVFVLAVVGFVVGFALGGFPAVISAVNEPVDTVSDLVPFDSVGLGGAIDGQQTGSTVDPTANRTPVPSSSSAELNGTHLEYLVHRGINERRAAHGKSNLSFDTELRSIARYHSADMARQDYFGHVSPDGETLSDRYRKFDYQCRVPIGGFRYATGGGNVLYTYYDTPVRTGNHTVRYDTPRELARGIVNGWMNSTEHRKNLLKPYWNREGIGIYIEQVGGRTRVYATQNFC